eukprot:SAG22_NODE_7371_length_746_cov_2.034003_2_plen_182_part_01
MSWHGRSRRRTAAAVGLAERELPVTHQQPLLPPPSLPPEMMLKSVGAVMVTAFFLFSAGGGAAAQKVDSNDQLKGLDVREGLKEIIGSMMLEMRGLKKENAVLLREQNRTRVVEEELRGGISWLKKDRDAFQNKTQAVEKENAALRIEVIELRNQTKKDIQRINTRLDQCEADTHPFVKEME